MTQGNLIRAYKAVNALTEQRLPLPISYKLFKLKKSLQPVWDFQLQEEERIFNLYPPTDREGNQYKFATPEDAQGFREAFKELREMESDIEFKPLNLPMLESMNLSGEEIDALTDVIFFTEPEEPEM